MTNNYRIQTSLLWVIGFYVILASFRVEAQIAQSQVIQWQKTIESAFAGGEVRIVKSGTSGYGILTNYVGRLARLSATGEVNWLVRIPTSSPAAGSIYESTGLVATQDNGYIVLARDTYGWYITKVDANGNGVWSKLFESFNPTSNNQVAKKNLIQTTDGKLLVVGYQSSPRGPTLATVQKLDSEGNLLWSKSYYYNEYGVYVRAVTNASRIIEMPDGNYIAVGLTRGDDNVQYPTRGWAIKLDQSGNVIWQKRYEDRALLDDIIPSPYYDGPAIASGVNSLNTSATNTLNIDANGSAGSGYYQPNRVVNSSSVVTSVPARNGLPAYHTVLDNVDQNAGDLRLINLTNPNEIVWTKTLGGSGTEQAQAIIPTDDGGYLVAGTTTSTDGDVQGKTTNSLATWIVKVVPVQLTDLYSVQDGSWNEPSTWSTGQVPTSTDIVHLKHNIVLPPNYLGNANRVIYDLPIQLRYETGARLLLGQ